jgi:hypothetical protein
MGNKEFWCLTTYFNPAGYQSRIRNHEIFADNMAKQNVNLVTIELAFGQDNFHLKNTIQLRANSVLWQKERMINYAMTQLPKECKYIAWVDGDVLFQDNNWADLAVNMLQTNDVLQLFQEVYHLPPKESTFSGKHVGLERSFVWQIKNHANALDLRRANKLPYATVGFAWAARKEIFDRVGGMYDKHVLGSNDNLVIDCCLNSFDLHHYWNNVNDELKADMKEWAARFGVGTFRVDYLPVTIYHLFHGHKKFRGYIGREQIVKKYKYDPKVDIRLENNVYEWNTDKPGLHEDCHNYFYTRKEDDETIPENPHIRL